MSRCVMYFDLIIAGMSLALAWNALIEHAEEMMAYVLSFLALMLIVNCMVIP